MGSSQSAPRLQTPLHAQAKPFLATTNGVVSETFTSLHIKPRSFSSTIDVVDAQTTQLVFQIKSAAFTSRKTLQTPSGRVMMSMKQPAFSSSKRVYDGDQTDQEAFSIVTKLHAFSPTVIYAEFQDRSSGDSCRVIMEGNSYDRVVLMYLERGYNQLPPLDKHDDRSSGRFQAIGRIHRADTGMFSSEEFFVEAAPGVDLSLLLLLWRVRYDIECERRASASTSAPASS